MAQNGLNNLIQIFLILRASPWHCIISIEQVTVGIFDAKFVANTHISWNNMAPRNSQQLQPFKEYDFTLAFTPNISVHCIIKTVPKRIESVRQRLKKLHQWKLQSTEQTKFKLTVSAGLFRCKTSKFTTTIMAISIFCWRSQPFLWLLQSNQKHSSRRYWLAIR